MIRGHDFLVAERPEDEARADECEVEQPVNRRAELLENRLAGRGLEHEQRENHLQRQPPHDGSPVDGPAVRGHRVRDSHDHDKADERLQLRHCVVGDESKDGRGCGGSAQHHQVTRIVWDSRQWRPARRCM